MTDQWYLVPVAGEGSMTDPYEPVLADTFDGFSGYHLEEENLYLVRYFGDSGAANALNGVSEAKQLTQEKTATRLNTIFDEDLSLTAWNERFSIGGSQ